MTWYSGPDGKMHEVRPGERAPTLDEVAAGGGVKKWDPQTQEWVEKYPDPSEPETGPNPLLMLLLGAALTGLVVLGAYLIMNRNDVPPEPPVTMVDPEPSTPVIGDIELTNVDGVAYAILNQFLLNGTEGAAFVIANVKATTSCEIVHAVGPATIDGVEGKYHKHSARWRERYGEMYGTAVREIDGVTVALEVVFRCPKEG